MPTHYDYRCPKCGHVERRYRNSTKCRECHSTIERVDKQDAPVTGWTRVTEGRDIPSDNWLLGVIEWNEPHKRPSVRLVCWDDYRQEWRTQWGKLKDHWEVTHWMPLPDLPPALEAKER